MTHREKLRHRIEVIEELSHLITRTDVRGGVPKEISNLLKNEITKSQTELYAANESIKQIQEHYGVL